MLILCKFGKGLNGYQDMHVVFLFFSFPLSLSVICHIVPLLLLLLWGVMEIC